VLVSLVPLSPLIFSSHRLSFDPYLVPTVKMKTRGNYGNYRFFVFFLFFRLLKEHL
jgi:hypothetical protein